MPSIHETVAAVMADVRSVAKDETNPEDGYRFRGIDGVLAAVGPAFRSHRLVPAPKVLAHESVPVDTTDGPGFRTTVMVRYRFHGPAGDHFDVTVPGEAIDGGDKGTAKAMSVAYRTALLQLLALPTHEPDPDSVTYRQARPAHRERPRPVDPPRPAEDHDAVAADQLHRLAEILGEVAAVEFWQRGGPLGRPRSPRSFEAMLTTARRMADQAAAQGPTPDEWVETLTPTEVAGHLAAYDLAATGDLAEDRALLAMAALEETTDAAA